MYPSPHTTIPLCTAYCVHCIQWFDLFAPKPMSPPPYTSIPLHTASTASTGLTFLHQRQCPHHHIPLFHCVLCPLHQLVWPFCTKDNGPHHHIPLFHCVLCPLHPLVWHFCTKDNVPTTTYHYSTASCVHCINWFDLFAPKTMVPHTIYHYSTAYCVHCIHWFDIFAPKTMSPPPYTTIPLCTASTASTGLTFLHQRQCPHHHIPLFHCILRLLHTASTASTCLTFLHQSQCPHYHIPLFHCVLRPLCPLHTASTAYCIHCVLHALHTASTVCPTWPT